jgi:hypothetical protein
MLDPKALAGECMRSNTMLTGAAKTAYQREWMRRKRAGLPTAKPKAAAGPRQRVIDQISRWVSLRSADRLYGRGAAILDGLSFVNGGDNTAFWQQACRRYQGRRRCAEAAEAQVVTSLPVLHRGRITRPHPGR